jgi:hypothetical protein
VSTTASAGGGPCWYVGAVQAYDAISQNISTTIGLTYVIAFSVADNNTSSIATYQDLSTNGHGNAANVLGLYSARTSAARRRSGVFDLGDDAAWLRPALASWSIAAARRRRELSQQLKAPRDLTKCLKGNNFSAAFPIFYYVSPCLRPGRPKYLLP